MLVESRLKSGVGDLGEVAARRTRPLHLGDDLHAVGGCQGGEGVTSRSLRESSCFDQRRRARDRARLGILNRAGREVGEHGQCSFEAYFGPLAP